MLGPDHVARCGADPALLVKLLDAGERLPVHFHPGRAFAREQLGLRFGKTEAWIILEAEPGAAVHVGLREPLDPRRCAAGSTSRTPTRCSPRCTSVPVAAGDAMLVPAGTLHAIGAGILLLELQEPTDLSVLVEWKPFGVDRRPRAPRLGWDTALQALDREPADIAALTTAATRLLPNAADPYFRAERVTAAATSSSPRSRSCS